MIQIEICCRLGNVSLVASYYQFMSESVVWPFFYYGLAYSRSGCSWQKLYLLLLFCYFSFSVLRQFAVSCGLDGEDCSAEFS